MKKQIFKTIAFIILVVFTSETLLWATPDFVYSYRVDTEHANVKQRYNAVSEKTIVLVQDAHSSFEAQFNISKIIEEFGSLCSKETVPLIAVEGAVGDLSLAKYRSFPVPQARDVVSYDYMRSGRFTGSEYAGIVSEKEYALFGVENKELFYQNFREFSTVAASNNALSAYIETLDADMETFKQHIYTEDLLTFDQLYSDFKNDALSFTHFLPLLFDYANKAEIDIYDYVLCSRLFEVLSLEKGIDFELAKKERDALVTRMKQDGREVPASEQGVYIRQYLFEQELDPEAYHNFLSSLHYAEAFRTLPFAEILSEIDRLSERISDLLADSSEAHTLLSYDQLLTHIASMVSLDATRSDTHDVASVNISERLHEITTFLALQGEGVYADCAPYAPVVESVQNFYQNALRRETYMVDNLINEMDRRDVTEALFVAGGFHTEGIIAELSQRNIDYILVTPQVSSGVSDLPYLEKMTGALFPLAPQVSGTIQALATFVASQELIWNFTEESLAELFRMILIDEIDEELLESLRLNLSIETNDKRLQLFLRYTRENFQTFLSELRVSGVQLTRSEIVDKMHAIAKTPYGELSAAEKMIEGFVNELLDELEIFYKEAPAHDKGTLYVPLLEGVKQVRSFIDNAHAEDAERPVIVILTGNGNAGKSTLLDGLKGMTSFFPQDVVNFGRAEAKPLLGISGDMVYKHFNRRKTNFDTGSATSMYEWYYRMVLEDDFLNRYQEQNGGYVLYERYLWERYFNRIFEGLSNLNGRTDRVIVFDQAEPMIYGDILSKYKPNEDVTVVRAHLDVNPFGERKMQVHQEIWRTDTGETEELTGGRWPWLDAFVRNLPLNRSVRDMLQVILEETFVFSSVLVAGLLSPSHLFLAGAVVIVPIAFYLLHFIHKIFPQAQDVPETNAHDALVMTYMNFMLVLPFAIARYAMIDLSLGSGIFLFTIANAVHYFYMRSMAAIPVESEGGLVKKNGELSRRGMLKSLGFFVPTAIAAAYYFKNMVIHGVYLSASVLHGVESHSENEYLTPAEKAIIDMLKNNQEQLGDYLSRQIGIDGLTDKDQEHWRFFLYSLNRSDWGSAAEALDRLLRAQYGSESWQQRFFETFTLTTDNEQMRAQMKSLITGLWRVRGVFGRNGDNVDWLKWGWYPIVAEEEGMGLSPRKGSFFYWADFYNNIYARTAMTGHGKGWGKEVPVDLVNGHHWYLHRFAKWRRDNPQLFEKGEKTVCVMFDSHRDLTPPVHDPGTVLADLEAGDDEALGRAAAFSEISGYNLPLIYAGKIDELVWVVAEEARREMRDERDEPFFINYVPDDGKYTMIIARSRETGKLIVASEDDRVEFSFDTMPYADIEEDLARPDHKKLYDIKTFPLHVLSVTDNNSTYYYSDDLHIEPDMHMVPDASYVLNKLTEGKRTVYSFDLDFFGTGDPNESKDILTMEETFQLILGEQLSKLGINFLPAKKAILPNFTPNYGRFVQLLSFVENAFLSSPPEYIGIATSPNFTMDKDTLPVLRELLKVFDLSLLRADNPEWVEYEMQGWNVLDNAAVQLSQNSAAASVIGMGAAMFGVVGDGSRDDTQWHETQLQTLEALSQEVRGQSFDLFAESVAAAPGKGIVYITEGLRQEIEREPSFLKTMVPDMAKAFGVEFVMERRAGETEESVLIDGVTMRLGSYSDALVRVRDIDTDATGRNIIVLARENEERNYAHEGITLSSIFEFSFDDAAKIAREFAVLQFLLLRFFEAVKEGNLLDGELFVSHGQRKTLFRLNHDIISEQIVSELLQAKIEEQFAIAA